MPPSKPRFRTGQDRTGQVSQAKQAGGQVVVIVLNGCNALEIHVMKVVEKSVWEKEKSGLQSI